MTVFHQALVSATLKYKEPFDNQQSVTQPVSENVLEIELGGEFGNDDMRNSAAGIMGSDLNTDDSAIYDHLGNFGEGSDSLGVDFNDDPLADLPDFDGSEPAPQVDFNPMGSEQKSFDDENDLSPLYETIKRIVETKLNDFGKHPAYQKVVMSLPKNADGSEWGEDWNDESAKGEEPYGKQIGDSAPFDDVVSAITNAVVTSLSGKKKE